MVFGVFKKAGKSLEQGMKKQTKTKKEITRNGTRKKGFIAAYALIAASLIVVLLTGLFVFVSGSHQKSLDGIYRQQALQFAESGVYFYKWYLAHNLDGKNSQQIKNFWESGVAYGLNETYQKEIVNEAGDPIGTYEINVSIPSPNSTIVTVESVGWTVQHPEIRRSIRVRFRRPSWSEYSVLGNDMLRFGSDTNIFGPVHSNSGIRFDGIANNLITSSVETYWDPDAHSIKPGVWTSQSNEEEIFLAGNDYPVAAVDFNGVTMDLALIRDEAISEGIFLDSQYEEENCRWRFGRHWCGGRFWCRICETETFSAVGHHITLRTDDKIEVRAVFDYQGNGFHEPKTYKIKSESDATIYDIPENGLIFVNSHAWVDGQIDTALVTIAAADLDLVDDKDIYINDNILYTNKDGQDVLGLIAEDDILIGLYSANDLEIDAAILAKSGKVGRDYYTQSQSNAFYKRDKITIFGSIATYQRYGFAWTDGTGYQIRNLYFDNNLLYTPPPFFPTGTTYELDLWEDL